MSFLGKLMANLKADVSSGTSRIKTEGEQLFAQIDKDITPTGYALLQAAVLTAEATGGTWEAKLAAAVATATATFAKQGLPVVINDMVAVITTIVADMKTESTKLASSPAA